MVAESDLSAGYPDNAHEASGPADFGLALKLKKVGVLLSTFTKKSRATRFGRVAPFSIESLSFRFPINLLSNGSVLPWPPSVN
jgi:hypothetical protein